MTKTETGPGGWARKLDPLAVEKSDIELLIERLAEYAAKAGESGDERAEDDRRALTAFAPLLEAAPAMLKALRARYVVEYDVPRAPQWSEDQVLDMEADALDEVGGVPER